MKPETVENENALRIRFARLLEEQLDGLDFPAGARRAGALRDILEVAPTQAYKLLRGMASPSLANLLDLRELGVSLDEIFESLGERSIEVLDLHFSGNSIPATVQFAPNAKRTPVVAVPRPKGDGLDLIVLANGAAMPLGAKAVRGITFPSKCSLAIVEDSAADAQVLKDALGSDFRLACFSNATGLLAQAVETFEVFVLDWNLPDMQGLELVRAIRQRTKAPIFILTADQRASVDIVRAMDFADVHHAAKPIDIKILAKRLTSVLNLSQN